MRILLMTLRRARWEEDTADIPAVDIVVHPCFDYYNNPMLDLGEP